mmetsp:Transcript_46262/g.99057  ORF Transcript_46262/g.99057 Transcript_46262/m.99057 type:complete len:119 (+) Transcript_46262:1262-1618(+)
MCSTDKGPPKRCSAAPLNHSPRTCPWSLATKTQRCQSPNPLCSAAAAAAAALGHTRKANDAKINNSLDRPGPRRLRLRSGAIAKAADEEVGRPAAAAAAAVGEQEEDDEEDVEEDDDE